MKKQALIIAIFALFTASVFGLQPIEYPGALPLTDGSNHYITNDSYDKVFNFYTEVYGNPDNEGLTTDSKRAAFFVSDKNWREQHSWKLDPPGVQISELQGNSQAVSRVFWALEGLIERDLLTKKKYDEIEGRYIGLKYHYYKPGEDQAIQKRYEQKLLEGGDPVAIQEQTMARMQELVMAGRFQEATALAEKMKDGILENVEMANSEKAVDEWVKCLEEIKAISHPVLITISQ